MWPEYVLLRFQRIGILFVRYLEEVEALAVGAGNVDIIRRRFKESGEGGKHEDKVSGKCRYTSKKKDLIGYQNMRITPLS